MHELLSPGVWGLDILYIATREESKEIKDEEGRRKRERVRQCMNIIITSCVEKTVTIVWELR